MSIYFRNLADLAFDVVHTVLFNGSAVKFIEVLARGTDINVEDIDLYIRIFITNQHRMLCSVHAAALRAVTLSAAGRITGSHTLDKGYGLRCLMIGQTLQMTLCRASRIGQTLKLQGSNDIRAGIIGILTKLV